MRHHVGALAAVLALAAGDAGGEPSSAPEPPEEDVQREVLIYAGQYFSCDSKGRVFRVTRRGLFAVQGRLAAKVQSVGTPAADVLRRRAERA